MAIGTLYRATPWPKVEKDLATYLPKVPQPEGSPIPPTKSYHYDPRRTSSRNYLPATGNNIKKHKVALEHHMEVLLRLNVGARNEVIDAFKERQRLGQLYQKSATMGCFEKAQIDAEMVRDWDEFEKEWVIGGKQTWEQQKNELKEAKRAKKVTFAVDVEPSEREKGKQRVESEVECREREEREEREEMRMAHAEHEKANKEDAIRRIDSSKALYAGKTQNNRAAPTPTLTGTISPVEAEVAALKERAKASLEKVKKKKEEKEARQAAESQQTRNTNFTGPSVEDVPDEDVDMDRDITETYNGPVLEEVKTKQPGSSAASKRHGPFQEDSDEEL